MKRVLAVSVLIVSLIVVGIPLLVFRGYQSLPDNSPEKGPLVRVLNKSSGKVINVDLEQYLVGVVAAEMPAEFEAEALKAQAIAARTYTAKRMFEFGAKPGDRHPGAEICTDPVHCQAWISENDMKNKWGRVKYYLYIEKIRKAVEYTRGLVITYNNQLIDPVYHGSCGGIGTENSEDVWSLKLPYLKGVDCPQEYRAAEQTCQVETDKQKILAAFKSAGLKSSYAQQPLLEVVEKSKRNRVIKAKVLGNEITGSELRRVLGLTSTYIQWEIDGDLVNLKSSGKGHAVGLCQYGANGMARDGKTFVEILKHYYSGVVIKKI